MISTSTYTATASEAAAPDRETPHNPTLAIAGPETRKDIDFMNNLSHVLSLPATVQQGTFQQSLPAIEHQFFRRERDRGAKRRDRDFILTIIIIIN
jgi:hypothetical protein